MDVGVFGVFWLGMYVVCVGIKLVAIDLHPPPQPHPIDCVCSHVIDPVALV